MNENQTIGTYFLSIVKRLPKLFLGFFIISIGIQIMINSNLGLNPWGIFHSGLSKTFQITFGRAAQLTGFGIILISTILKIYPGIGTVLNMIFIGYFVDLVASLGFLPLFDNFFANIISFFIGTFIFSFGIYFYLNANLGPGPRDGLMLALTKITPFTAGRIKIIMEISISIIGFLMGGSIGIGTIIAAFFGGIFIDLLFKLFKFNPKSKKFPNLFENYKEIKTILYNTNTQ